MDLLNTQLPSIQLAITPVILISGMGALMLSLTNRMGRVVDRTRRLAEMIQTADAGERGHLEHQLDIMWGRALLIRRAVTFSGLSMLLSCLLIVAIFASALFAVKLGSLVLVLFGTSILLLTASLVDFLRDIFVSLHAVKLQIEWARGRPVTNTPEPRT